MDLEEQISEANQGPVTKGCFKALQQVEVGRTRGMPWEHVFLFTKEGTVLLHGSYDKVRDLWRDKSPCHGLTITYRKIHAFRPWFATEELFTGVSSRDKSWDIHGKTDLQLGTLDFEWEKKIHDDSGYGIRRTPEDRYDFSKSGPPPKRKVHYLYRWGERGQKPYQVIKFIRHMPSKYMKELGHA